MPLLHIEHQHVHPNASRQKYLFQVVWST